MRPRQDVGPGAVGGRSCRPGVSRPQGTGPAFSLLWPSPPLGALHSPHLGGGHLKGTQQEVPARNLDF